MKLTIEISKENREILEAYGMPILGFGVKKMVEMLIAKGIQEIILNNGIQNMRDTKELINKLKSDGYYGRIKNN